MLALGVVAAIIAMGLVARQFGFMTGVAVAIWVMWPFLHFWRVQRHNTFHPLTKSYKLSSQEIFVKLREILNETTYHFSDRWHVINADTEKNRIVAELRFVEEEDKFFDPGHPISRPEQVRRTLRFEALLLDIHEGALVQLDFSTRIDGLDQSACDSLVTNLVDTIDTVLGVGVPITTPMSYKLPAPPWWIFLLTGVCLIGGSFLIQALVLILSPIFFAVLIALIFGYEIEELLESVAGMYVAAIELMLAKGAAFLAAQGIGLKDDHKRPQRPSLPRW